MALPDGSRELGDLPFRTGITLGIGLSSDFSFSVEVQRMTSGSTWETADVLSGLGAASFHGRWTDVLPLDNLLRTYRARSIAPGWQSSSWTGTVARRPVRLSLNMPKPIPLGGQGVGGSLHFQRSSATVKVGTDRSSSFVTKRQRIHGFSFQANVNRGSSVYRYGDQSGVSLSTQWSGGLVSFGTWLPMAPGTVLVAMRIGYRRQSTNTVVQATLTRLSASSAAADVAVAAVTPSVTTGVFRTSSSVTFTEEASTRGYLIQLGLTKNSSAVNNAVNVKWVELTYRMPRYDRGY